MAVHVEECSLIVVSWQKTGNHDDSLLRWHVSLALGSSQYRLKGISGCARVSCINSHLPCLAQKAMTISDPVLDLESNDCFIAHVSKEPL